MTKEIADRLTKLQAEIDAIRAELNAPDDGLPKDRKAMKGILRNTHDIEAECDMVVQWICAAMYSWAPYTFIDHLRQRFAKEAND